MKLGPHPFTLRQLQYFVAVAESLSFRRAAERCHVAQPSLSMQLAQLEQVLGVRLFERDSRRVMLTGAGRDLLARANELLVRADDLLGAAHELGAPFAGVLQVGVIPTVSPYLLPTAAAALSQHLAKVTLTWIEDKTEVLLDRLERGAVDAAVLALDPGTEHLEQATVAIDPFLCAVPKGHPLARGKAPLSLSSLAHEKVLLLDEGHCLREQALSVCTTARAEELEFRATSIATLVQMVASGRGITLLPRLAVDTEARRADLVLRRFGEPVPHRTLGVVWRRSSPMGTTLRRLSELVRRAYPVVADRARPQ